MIGCHSDGVKSKLAPHPKHDFDDLGSGTDALLWVNKTFKIADLPSMS